MDTFEELIKPYTQGWTALIVVIAGVGIWQIRGAVRASFMRAYRHEEMGRGARADGIQVRIGMHGASQG